MTLKTILTIMIFAGSLLVISVLEADAARRFGGGRSFGSKPGMQRSTQAPKQEQPGMTQSQQGTQQGSAAAAAGQRPGMFGGMGGMLGGLLAGSLIGSLLFGGAFTGGGMMDILLIAILLYFAFKLFSRSKLRQNTSAQSANAGGMSMNGNQEGRMQYQATPTANAGDVWGNLRQGGAEAAASATQAALVVPEGFDVEEFLKGAKMAYNRLQASWDKRDMDDIALFTSEFVQEEVKKQFDEDTEPGKTEILLCNAQLLSVEEANNEQRATVFFDVLLREAPSAETVQVREVWHFVLSLDGGSWKLDGIQQVEV